MLKAAIFDMDGLLVDSEPFWQQAQLDILQPLGVEITRHDTTLTTGVRIDQIVNLWYSRFPWPAPSKETVVNQIVQRVGELVAKYKPLMPGVHEVLALCRKRELKIGLASSSPLELIHTVLKALDMTQTFDAIESAKFLAHGKPHPEVYLKCAQALHVQPTQCIAFEDSLPGLIAAKAARMHTVVVPEKSQLEDPRWSIADYCLASLQQVTHAHLN
ncbi:hexitol phosphatase HxpB [Plesiomonas shigelloides]|uniref:hexitol phosphatase HxpB n=1 Tax=Plesiomonas shigelloides TaxID=703 RepID=UPI0030C5DD73